MIECVELLHSLGLAHMDIKLENFVIGDDFSIKMIDFEMMKELRVPSNVDQGTN